MSPVNFSLLTSMINFSTVTIAILSIFSALVVVAVTQKGIRMVTNAVRGDMVFYGGKYWDKDVYDTAMQNLVTYKQRGGALDRESSAALKEWKNNRARDGLF